MSFWLLQVDGPFSGVMWLYGLFFGVMHDSFFDLRDAFPVLVIDECCWALRASLGLP